MQEKVVIKSMQFNLKKIRTIIWIVGIVLAFVVFLLTLFEDIDYYIEKYAIERIIGHITEYLFLSMIVFFVPVFVIGQLFYMGMSKNEVTVTTKRIYGKNFFGKRVDLPLDMISAIGTTLFHGIAITTASGAIKFQMIKNSKQIHDAISNLLMERQEANKKSASAVIKQEIPQSNAEELRKYKDLLDMGVISKEEFDAKKKQLLGL